MTGRTHDLAAFTALTILFVSLPTLPVMTLSTVVLAFGANFLGGLFPDIDQPTSDLWDNFRGGSFMAKVVCSLLGGHRHLSHSLIGIWLIGWGSQQLLRLALPLINLPIDGQIVWQAFMIGVISHVVMDMPTKAGVPLLWPLKVKLGIPPIRKLRIESGKFVENWVVFPGLLLLNAYLLIGHRTRVVELVSRYI